MWKKKCLILMLVAFCVGSVYSQKKLSKYKTPVFSSIYLNTSGKLCKEIEEEIFGCKPVSGYRIMSAYHGLLEQMWIETVSGKEVARIPSIAAGQFTRNSGKVEWRLANGKPFAVITRFTIFTPEEMETNKDLTNDYSQFPQLLVVKGLTGFEQIDFEIDARTNDANKKARDLADAWFVKKLETIPALPKPKEVVRMEFVPRVSQSNAVLTASDLPKAEDISKISFFASSVEMKWFTEKSLLETLPRLVSSYQVYRPKMLFQSGVITLKNGVVLGWRAENSQSIWLYTDSSERLFELPTRAAELPLVPRPKCSTYLSEYDAGKILGKLMELSNDQLTGESLKLVGDQVEGKKVETCHYRWKHSSSFQIEATFEFFPTAQAANEPLSGFKHLAGEQNSRRDPRIQEFQSIAGIGDEAWLITGDESIEICVQKGATLFSIRSRQVQLVSVDELKRVAKKVAKQF